jgi:hypothetical protein
MIRSSIALAASNPFRYRHSGLTTSAALPEICRSGFALLGSTDGTRAMFEIGGIGAIQAASVNVEFIPTDDTFTI